RRRAGQQKSSKKWPTRAAKLAVFQRNPAAAGSPFCLRRSSILAVVPATIGRTGMATGTVQPVTLPPPPPIPGESKERERIIQRQLARTSWQLRLIDLASGIATWIIGVLVLFIVCALVDHLAGLGAVGR